MRGIDKSRLLGGLLVVAVFTTAKDTKCQKPEAQLESVALLARAG